MADTPAPPMLAVTVCTRWTDPVSFEQMWSDLLPLGRDARTGGYFRQPFTAVEREMDAWFVEQAAARDLVLETDAWGNRIAWWEPAGTDRSAGTGVVTGSHLDSVLDGGAFDGPLGVVSAFAAVDELRARGVVPQVPVGVSVFVEEEGSRFGLACLGSRLATGAMDWGRAQELRDREGVALADALAHAGLDPAGSARLSPIGCFVELHVEQGRNLVDVDAAIGVASGIWPHGRYRFDFTGQANHAGSTRMEDRHDPMLTYAMTVLAANKAARASAGGRATFGRVEAFPNSTNAVPSQVTAWLDARCASEGELAALLGEVERLARDRAGRDGTQVSLTPESVSGAVHFDHALTSRIGTGRGEHPTRPGDWPVLPSQAGHDAGILAAAGVPTAMIFVRNPAGISHSPAEHVDPVDQLAGVAALADALQRLVA